ncbi:hypothetical protein D3C73_1182770 [compost metagenome]
MFAACTADADNDLGFALLVILGNQKMQHIEQLGQECLRFGPLHYIIVYIAVLARVGPKMVHIMRIWQKAYVKHKVCVDRNAVFEAEGGDIDGKRAFSKMGKAGYDLLFKLRRLHAARINDKGCRILELLQHLPFQPDTVQRHAFGSERMTTSALLVALHQHGIGCIEEQNFAADGKLVFHEV